MIEFKDPRYGLSNPYATFKRTNESLDFVKHNLLNDPGYQVNRQIKPVYFPIIGHGSGSWQIDLLFPPAYKGVGIILCCIEVNTRWAYAYPFRNKKDTYNFLVEWLKDVLEDKRDIQFVQADKGSEFNNAKVKELFEEYDITLEFVNTGDKTAQGMVERFNETLRRLISLYCSSNNNNDWVSVFGDLMYNYNHRYNRNLGTSPAEANEKTDVGRKMKQFSKAEAIFNSFKVGDSVRVLEQKNIFDKGRQVYSTDVYRIESIEGIFFKLSNDKLYKYFQLQKVNGDTLPNDFKVEQQKQKNDKRTTRALNKEGITANTEVKHERQQEKIKFDASLVGRKVIRKGIEGEIIKYDPDGRYKWLVKWNDGDRESEYFNKKEITLYLVKK